MDTVITRGHFIPFLYPFVALRVRHLIQLNPEIIFFFLLVGIAVMQDTLKKLKKSILDDKPFKYSVLDIKMTFWCEISYFC